MKKIIGFVFIFLLMGLTATAQSVIEFKGYFGISESVLARKVEFAGGGGVEMNNLKEVGVLLSTRLNQKLSLSGGVGYSFGTVHQQFDPCPSCSSELTIDPNSDFKMLSFPVYAEYALGKYFYAAAGPIIDIELEKREFYSDQSGIGYLIGMGARLQTEKLSFSIFPNYKRHSVIPFDNSPNYKHILQELGVQLGVGLRF